MTYLRWVLLRRKTVLSYPWNELGKAAARRAYSPDTGERIAIGVYFRNKDGMTEHRLDFDPNTGLEIE